MAHAAFPTGNIYRRITSYVKLQLTVLSSVLQLMLLATIFNVNGGVALFPMQLLFCKFSMAAFRPFETSDSDSKSAKPQDTAFERG